MKHIRLQTKMERVETTSTPMDIYVAKPNDNDTYPGIIVGFELFGLTQYVRRMANEIASFGYVVIVPDFYHRSGSGISLQADDEGRKHGFKLLEELDRTSVLADVGTAVKFLADDSLTSSHVGFVGFSIGGHIGFLAATQYHFEAVVAFYPGWLTVSDISLSRPQPTALLARNIGDFCKILICVGDNDGLIHEGVREELTTILKSGNVNFDIVVFNGAAHGFMCDERPETYNPIVAREAWRRMREFLEVRLKPVNA